MACAVDLERSMASPASFQPATLPGTDRRSLLPAWVLLDKDAHIENRRNATEARSQTSGGQQVIVSFSTAEPPGLSHFSVHCPGLSVHHFATQPCVVHTDKNLALLSLCLKAAQGASQTEYFVYSTGSRPSLRYVHGIGSYMTATMLSISTIGFLTLSDDNGERFVLAELRYTLTAGQYEVHVFRSEPGTWTCNTLLEAELSAHGMVLNPEKVINLGGGKVGWVDLWRGILVCNVVDENPALCFIPLPTLLPANQAEFKLKERGNARHFRDVVFCSTDGGVIRCVEREICTRRVVRETRDVSGAEVLHDSEFWSNRDEDAKEDYDEYLGWRIITWNRPVSSNCWHRGFLVHVDEILVNGPSHSSVMLDTRNLTLRELITGFPTLSMVDSEVIYLICKGELEDKKTWVVTINMRNKTAEELVLFTSGWSYFSGIDYIPCDLSKYLNTNSGHYTD